MKRSRRRFFLLSIIIAISIMATTTQAAQTLPSNTLGVGLSHLGIIINTEVKTKGYGGDGQLAVGLDPYAGSRRVDKLTSSGATGARYLSFGTFVSFAIFDTTLRRSGQTARREFRNYGGESNVWVDLMQNTWTAEAGHMTHYAIDLNYMLYTIGAADHGLQGNGTDSGGSLQSKWTALIGNMIDVKTGSRFTLSRSTKNKGFGWGWNGEGQLLRKPTITNPNATMPYELYCILEVVEIIPSNMLDMDAGFAHSIFLLDDPKSPNEPNVALAGSNARAALGNNNPGGEIGVFDAAYDSYDLVYLPELKGSSKVRAGGDLSGALRKRVLYLWGSPGSADAPLPLINGQTIALTPQAVAYDVVDFELDASIVVYEKTDGTFWEITPTGHVQIA